jgi:hypothetical protein
MKLLVLSSIWTFEHHIVLTLAAGSTRQPCLSLTLTFELGYADGCPRVVVRRGAADTSARRNLSSGASSGVPDRGRRGDRHSPLAKDQLRKLG